MEPVEPVLVVEHLVVRVGGALVLRDLSLRLPRGATLAIIGPNGAGKSVLLRTLVGALPHEGELRWAPGVRFGYLPQKLDLERDLPLSGRDLLKARAGLEGLSPAALEGAVRRVGLDDAVCARPIGALSGGQFQLLLFAFALLGDPPVLLLDEPTAGVDEPGRALVHELMHRIKDEQGATVLIVSHDLATACGRASHVLALGRGHARFGMPPEVLTPESLEEIYGVPLRIDARSAR